MLFPSRKGAGGGSSSHSPAARPGPRISRLPSARGRARQHRPSRNALSAWRLLPKGLRQGNDRHGGTQRAKSHPPSPPLTSSVGRRFFCAAFPAFLGNNVPGSRGERQSGAPGAALVEFSAAGITLPELRDARGAASRARCAAGDREYRPRASAMGDAREGPRGEAPPPGER